MADYENFACMSGTTMPTMCHIFVVTSDPINFFFKLFGYYLRCFTSCDAVTIFAPVATRSRAHCKETVAGHTSLSTALVKRNVKLQIHDK